MQRGQLARLPATDGRRSERRVVNIAASLREPGAEITDVEVDNLSCEGFAVQTDMAIEVGGVAWLKLPGLEAQKCTLVWLADGKAGFQFAMPLHRGTFEQLVSLGKPQVLRNHFGPQGAAAR